MPMTIDEIKARRAEIKTRLSEIDSEHAGERIPDHAKSEWNDLNQEDEKLDALGTELVARRERLEELSSDSSRQVSGDGATFQTRRPGATQGEDIWDLSTVRGSAAGPHEMARELRDRAMQAVERMQPAHERANREDAQTHVERLLNTRETKGGDLARHLLATGSPGYHRAFGKALAGERLTDSEGVALQAALSTTTTEGGFAVPFQLDPTVIPTSNGSVNPYRAISRVEPLVGTNEWRGVSSQGVTAGYATEASEVGDDAPTLAQPTVTVERADAFVPFSIEIGQDWAGLQSEMARAIQDAKDDLESDKFTNGTGTNEPEGVVVGATTVVETAAARAFAAGDLYATEEALPPRFRPRAQWVAERSIYNLVRQFDTQGGSQLWVDNLRLGLANQVPTPGNIGSTLLSYPANECSNMDASVNQAGNAIAVFGDFRHYLIAERLGMTVELVPHLFATGANRPSGQRGILAYWRNSAVVLAANAFRVLQVSSGS